jgi:hypothetical protein
VSTAVAALADRFEAAKKATRALSDTTAGTLLAPQQAVVLK